MEANLRLFLIIFAIFWFILTSYFLKKNKLPVKYSLIWYAIIIIMLILGAFPDILVNISNYCGFQTLSSFVIGIILTLLMFITLALTMIVATQRKRMSLVIQEISLLKKELDDLKNE